MVDWLRADDAKRIATGELSKIMYKIKDSAYNGEFKLVLDYKISQQLSEVLNNYGYRIEHVQDPVYEETPYGNTNKVESYKYYTIIYWL